MPTTPDVVLAARALTKVYETGGARTVALDGVTVDLPRGAFVSVMGPSGSGKSTLLHLLGGLDSPTSGEVLLEGAPLSGLPDRELTLVRRDRIGFVFQFFNLVGVLTVEENVALPAVIAGRRPAEYRSKLDALLELVGISDLRTKLPAQLSGGQQQRVAIARALSTDPAVLLADEPTGNLDSRTGDEVLSVISQVRRELGQTVVVVTHDPRVASHAEEVLYIRDGVIGGRLDVAQASEPRRARRSAAPNGRRTRTGRPTGGGGSRTDAVLAWLQELEA
ncbi:MAG TPA: ABC transporter ATP-binding protein [Actinomycetota bacterium]|nr:ABC transporter ATP-binding protein [Actinomycetota bacterium]